MDYKDFPLEERRRIFEGIVELAAHLPRWMLVLERGREKFIERGLVYAEAVEKMNMAAHGDWKATVSLEMVSMVEIFRKDGEA